MERVQTVLLMLVLQTIQMAWEARATMVLAVLHLRAVTSSASQLCPYLIIKVALAIKGVQNKRRSLIWHLA